MYKYATNMTSYSEEWSSKGNLVLRTAFSRDQPTKHYVQHLIMEDSDALWELLERHNAYIYVCGDARHMASDVHQALGQVSVTDDVRVLTEGVGVS